MAAKTGRLHCTQRRADLGACASVAIDFEGIIIVGSKSLLLLVIMLLYAVCDKFA